MGRGSGVVFVVILFLGACRGLPSGSDRAAIPLDPATVAVVRAGAGSRLRSAERSAPLGELDGLQVARLSRLLLPDGRLEESRDATVLTFPTPADADAFYQAVQWMDGMVRAHLGVRSRLGRVPDTGAAVVAETIRRHLVAELPPSAPEWGRLSLALADDSVWKAWPTTAGSGAILLSGLILSGPHGSLSFDRARELLSRTTVESEVPGWLSYLAWRLWRASVSAPAASEEIP